MIFDISDWEVRALFDMLGKLWYHLAICTVLLVLLVLLAAVLIILLCCMTRSAKKMFQRIEELLKKQGVMLSEHGNMLKGTTIKLKK